MQNVSGISKSNDLRVPFNSRSLRYKAPFGAVSTRQKVFLSFPVRRDIKANKVMFMLRRNTHTFEYEMHDYGEYDGYVNYCLETNFEREGVYYYRFEIHTDEGVLYCGKGKNSGAIIGDWLPEWQLSVYNSMYKTPDFIKGGVIYQIFCDRFNCSGNRVYKENAVNKNWSEDVTIKDSDGIFRANDFYGGNFLGIIDKLNYLRDLGVTAIYLTPIFKASSNHRYDTGDYMRIDEVLGTEEDFERLVKECEEKGISIILDGVFNHTGADSLYFNKFGSYPTVGAYQSKDSPYYDWYTFRKHPDEYVCWWGITVVPTIARDAVEYRELIAGKDGVIDKWTKKGVKGWRLDVVDELGGDFVEKIRERVHKVDTNGLIIGEVWEDASTKFSYGEERQYFYGRQLDGVMNYVYKNAVINYVFSGNGEQFAEEILTVMENYPKQSLDTCFTLIDSHDTARAINVLSGKDTNGMDKEGRKNYRLSKEEYETGKIRLKMASALQFFLPGVPCIYYGDEIGMQGFEDPINRRPFTWDNIDEDLLKHYRELGRLRRIYRDEFTKEAEISFNGEEVTIRRGRIQLRVAPLSKKMSLTVE